MANKNIHLHNAKKFINNEFYTLYEDIEAELQNYWHYFKNKIILMNCNDTEDKNFWKYFYNNFDKIKPKKIIGLGYGENAVASEYTGNGVIKRIKLNPFWGTYAGDFRNPESIEYLRRADIVVSNPPFSLFIEYMKQLLYFHKKFIVLGNMIAFKSPVIFNHFQNKKIWFGFHVRLQNFLNDSGELINLHNVNWYTNIGERPEPKKIILTKKYNIIDYPKYDSYNAINVDKVKDIPKDYYEQIGVPLTFLMKWNSNQFDLIQDIHSPTINGKNKFGRIAIKRKIYNSRVEEGDNGKKNQRTTEETHIT